MFRLALPAAFAAIVAVFPSSARADTPPPPVTITGNATLVSQYRFRGISLSNNAAAIQGTINVNTAAGPYAGFWSSSLAGFGQVGGSNVELDLYGGYKHSLGSGLTGDAGLLYYAYPGHTGGPYEFFEPYAKLTTSVGPASVTFSGAYAPKQKAIGDHANRYLAADGSLPIKGTPISLTGHVGWSHGHTTLTPGGDYHDWSLGAQGTYKNLTISAAYVDTDISSATAIAVGTRPAIVHGAAVLSLGASF